MKIYDDISVIKGVGPKIKENLNQCLIFNVMDLILYFPRDYEVINHNVQGKSLLKCKVVKIERYIRTKTSKLLTTVVFDNSGRKLKGKWFNQPYIKNQFVIGEEYKLLGKIQIYNNEETIINPTIVNNNSIYINAENKETIMPIYPLKNGVTNTIIMKLVKEVLNNINISENMPNWVLDKYKFFSLEEAINTIHFPEDSSSLNMARERLKFQELFTYSLKILALKEFHKVNKEGISFKISKVMNTVQENLNYELTEAQRRVLREILTDERKALPMNRLLQGDVGSGKTIVALISILNVIKNGFQTVLMAPTEILANQHYSEALNFLGMYGIKSELLCGSTSLKNKEIIKSEIKLGNIDLIIGTHALLEDDVEFKNLGLVVTDEQHRFGVMQRSKLINKDKCVDTLVMTATPIPRTLSLLLYGDLNLSIIDELPPGRKRIDTFVFNEKDRKKLYEFTRKEIKKGRQAYIVCPLIEENENLNLNSVESLYEKLKKHYFEDIELSILHGKMKGNDKDKIMQAFKQNKINAIISTTVIEVGINVPNATIMIVEDAERFGLAQLHQLRGRVGRGEEKSYCMLISSSKNPSAKERLTILKNSNDGFFIAEEDLKLRGSGQIFGIKQHGENGLILADVMEDISILKKASKDALKLFESVETSDKKIKEEFIKKVEKNSKFICFN